MPLSSLLTEWGGMPAGLETLVWGLCGVFALMFIAALVAFAVEVAGLLRDSGAPIPAREFQGFGRSAPRSREPAPAVPGRARLRLRTGF